MTPIGSRSGVLMARFSLAFARPGSLLAEPPQRGGDGDHLARAQRLRERVGDPVDRPLRAPRDEAQPAPVVVQLELATVDPAGLGGVVQDRRRPPGHSLDPVVLADDALGDDQAVRAMALALLVADRVGPRLGAGVARALVAQDREVEREAGAPLPDDRLVLALAARGLEA